jgi:hypothetical protein
MLRSTLGLSRLRSGHVWGLLLVLSATYMLLGTLPSVTPVDRGSGGSTAQSQPSSPHPRVGAPWRAGGGWGNASSVSHGGKERPAGSSRGQNTAKGEHRHKDRYASLGHPVPAPAGGCVYDTTVPRELCAVGAAGLHG